MERDGGWVRRKVLYWYCVASHCIEAGEWMVVVEKCMDKLLNQWVSLL
jgi:hypothetical protein